MNKFKQVIKSLISDVMFCGIILGACIIAAIALKIIVSFGGIISSSGYVFIDIMLTYGIATFIIGWVGFRVYQVYNK